MSGFEELPEVSGGGLNVKAMLIGLAVIAPLLVVLALGFGRNPNVMDKPLNGKAAPDFSLPTLANGELMGLEDLRGKPMVVNFWATWCRPCAIEHPNLVQAARKWGTDVQFVGIVYQDKNEAVEAWLARNGGKAFPTLIDVNAKAAIAYGVYGVPETYFIGSDGVIRDKHVGPISWPQLAEQVRRLKEDAS